MPFLGELAALLTALCWAVGPMAFAAAIRRVGSVEVNVTRLALATLLLGVTVTLFGLATPLALEQVLLLSLSGIVGLVLGDSFLFQAFGLIGARLSMLVMSLAPAFAALLAYVVLDERLRPTGVFGIATTLVGVTLVVRERSPRMHEAVEHRGLGLLLALLGALGQAANLIFAKQAFNLGPIDGFYAAFIRLASSTLVLAPLMLVLGRYHNPWRTFAGQRRAFGLLLLGTVTGPYLGITFSLVAVKYAHVGVAATLMATVPVVMLPLVRYVEKERLSTQAKVGAVVAVVGVAMLMLL